jgi:hypothetical protein
VALCIKYDGSLDSGLLDEIGNVFSELFKESQHLDTVFVRDEHERQLAALCAPFFDGSTDAVEPDKTRGPAVPE